MIKDQKLKHLAQFLHDQDVRLVTRDLFDSVMKGHVVAGSEDDELTFTAAFGDAIVSLNFTAGDIYSIKRVAEIIELTLLRLNSEIKDKAD